MVADPERPRRQVLLDLPPASEKRPKPPRANLSAMALDGGSLYLGTDEGTALDRLTGSAADGFGGHAPLPLADALGLEGDGEIDIEGLDVDAGSLWIVGSHSRTRGKPGDDDPAGDLAELEHHANRHVLARFDLKGGPAARLPIGKKRGALAKALKADAHLKPFLKLPGKENGFDIEGIAAKGNRILLGLRGPVLRGIAVVLEIEVEEDGDGGLALRPIGKRGKVWRKHFLDLRGNGVRDLHRTGDDVLILAGPTADIDGRCFVWRWRRPLDEESGSFVGCGESLSRVLRLPVGEDADHPEGFCLLPSGELLVVYDSPAKARWRGDGGVLADVFALPSG